jgi:hypothetical protein
MTTSRPAGRCAATALALALGLAGCADEATAYGGARTFVDVVGTPVYAVTKGVTCVVTAAGSLPVAAVANAVPGPDRIEKGDTNRQIYRTVGSACGGSYALGE